MWNDDQLRKWECEQIVARIREIEKKRELRTIDEQTELDSLWNRLDTKRKGCVPHSYEIVTGLISIDKICKICGFVDRTYNHFRDGKS